MDPSAAWRRTRLDAFITRPYLSLARPLGRRRHLVRSRFLRCTYRRGILPLENKASRAQIAQPDHERRARHVLVDSATDARTHPGRGKHESRELRAQHEAERVVRLGARDDVLDARRDAIAVRGPRARPTR